LSPGQVRVAIEVTVTLLGWILGGPLGVGTVVAALVTGPMADLFFRLLGRGALDEQAPKAPPRPRERRWQEVSMPERKE